MITLSLGSVENFDPKTNSFEMTKGEVVRFEYSLKALYEWEGVWKKAFLDNNAQLSSEEVIDFYYKMALDPFDRNLINEEAATKLSQYISESNTATRFNAPPSRGGGSNSGKVHTAEEIYAMMFSNSIPLELENRNLNRLLVMLKIISSQNSPSKKMSRQDVLRQNAGLNAKRKEKLNTKG